MKNFSDKDIVDLAYSVAVDIAGGEDQVGEAQTPIEIEAGVFEYRFAVIRKGYEGWFWSITLYCDRERETWTVNESVMLPSSDALMAPQWIPWKDRLRPQDISVTDRLGTDPDDPRMQLSNAEDNLRSEADQKNQAFQDLDNDQNSQELHNSQDVDGDLLKAVRYQQALRRHIMSDLGKADSAQRWYAGPNGPKSLSTMTSKGNHCSSCAFYLPLQGQLGTMFGACANRWSPDDGRVVSLDHGCGEHSEIEPPEPSRLWVQSEPTYDDLHIDIIEQVSRDESAQVEMIEESVSRKARKRSARRHRN